FRPQMSAQVFAELVLGNGLKKMTAKRSVIRQVAVACKQGSGAARGHFLLGKQRIIGGAQIQVSHRGETPARPEAVEVGFVSNARFGGETVQPDVTPARPPAPEIVEHFIVLGFRIVASQEFVSQKNLIVKLVLKQIAEPAVDAERVDVA